MNKKSFISDKDGKLSKIVLSNCEDLSYATFCRALRNKDVKVNGQRISEDINVRSGDNIDVYYLAKKLEKFDVVYKDENVIVIDKKNGFASESIFEELYNENNNTRFIHRLDRNTNGLMIFALNEKTEKQLLSGFKNRTFEKYYLAKVMGKMPKKQDVLTAYLRKDSAKSQVYVYAEQVKDSVLIKTGYKVLQEEDGTSLLEIELFTGKTHQIRAHLAYVGHPVVGDGKYGDNAFNKKMHVKTQDLRAYKLVLHFEDNSYLGYLNGKTFERR